MIKAIINIKSLTVHAGDSVTLDASRSRGRGLKYLWAQIGGTTIKNYRGQNTAQLTFTAPDNTVGGKSVDHTLTFALTVTDDKNQKDNTFAKILVQATIINPTPQPPTPTPTGNIPTIDVVNHSHESDATVQQWIAAVQQQCDNDVVKYWGTAKLNFIGQDSPGDGNWHAGFFDTSDSAGILGWHDFGPGAEPLIKIFTVEAEKFHENPCTTFSHEIVETLADPTANITISGIDPNGRPCTFFQEVADPVEGNTYNINGLPVSNFALTSWFQRDSAGPWDKMGLTQHPFHILPQGYMEISHDNGQTWTEVFEEKHIVRNEQGQVLGRRIDDPEKIRKIVNHRKKDSRWTKYFLKPEERILSTYKTSSH